MKDTKEAKEKRVVEVVPFETAMGIIETMKTRLMESRLYMEVAEDPENVPEDKAD